MLVLVFTAVMVGLFEGSAMAAVGPAAAALAPAKGILAVENLAMSLG